MTRTIGTKKNGWLDQPFPKHKHGTITLIYFTGKLEEGGERGLNMFLSG